MAIAVERIHVKNNPQSISDRLQGKDPRANRPTLSTAPKDLNADLINPPKESLFGTFFPTQKARPGIMESVPGQLKASGVLSEREQIETECISTNF
jgi:hypothetical protein